MIKSKLFDAVEKRIELNLTKRGLKIFNLSHYDKKRISPIKMAYIYIYIIK